MVSGELPFSRETPLDTMHAIVFEEAKPVTSLRRNLPPQVHQIISRCLRKRPEDRYPDARLWRKTSSAWSKTSRPEHAPLFLL